ncbi:MAG: FAD binding domain-containing protein [Phycisphaeraceae bacterium]|nr:FAD binding domain-containing protein [Phycisphaeraceae bacterium]
MNRFAIAEARDLDHAAQLAQDERFSLPVIKAAGMDLLDLMKEGLLEPDALINIRRIGHGEIARTGDRMRIHALTTLAQIAESDDVARQAPALAQAAASAATPQVRNVATTAGNLLQRPRCWYFRSKDFHCLKKGGDRCYAVAGENKFHAIFGGGPCHIVHPSNLAVALFVLDASVGVVGARPRTLPIADLFHPPSAGVYDEHILKPGDAIESVSLAPAPRSGFYSIKEKQSFDWPLVMAAASLEVSGNAIQSARICAGAVAPTPWPLPRVAQALVGVRLDDDDAIAHACAASVQGASPMSQNAYKLRLLPVAIHRAIRRARGEEVE